MEPSPNPRRGYQSYGLEKTSLLTDLHTDVEHIQNNMEGEELEDERVNILLLSFLIY